MSNKIFSLDIYKALAALMVILIHITATPVVTLSSGSALGVILSVNRLAKPSVPMFVFASGLALFYVYKDRDFKFLEFIKKRLLKILIPYLFFCVVYYAYFVYAGVYSFSAGFLLKGILAGTLIYHLYFVIIIIQFYILYWFVHNLVKKYSPYLILPLTVIVGVASIIFVPSEYVGSFFGTYTTYFVLGCYFGKNYNKTMELIYKFKWTILSLFIISGGIYTYQFYEAVVLKVGYRFVNDAYAYYIFSTIALVSYFIIAELIEKAYVNGKIQRTRNLLIDISGASYYIYLAHPLGIIAGVSISSRMGISGVIDQMLISLAIIAVFVIPASMVYVKMKAKYKKSKMITKANIE
jgi:surface polysaccharide O-acyltransferase-like enzyme